VRQVARADDQHPLLRERRKRAPDADVVLGAERRLHRNLHYRHVRLRIHVQQGRPGAMVQAADGFLLRAERLQQFDRARSQCGRAGRRILDLVQRLREAVEIVDRLRFRRPRNRGRIGFPMRRGDEDRFGLRQLARDALPDRAHRPRLQRVHRRAVREEEDGQRRQLTSPILRP
jgi:hypothetical protein